MERVQFPPSCNIKKTLPSESWISGFLKFVYEFIHNFLCNSVYNDKQTNHLHPVCSRSKKKEKKKRNTVTYNNLIVN